MNFNKSITLWWGSLGWYRLVPILIFSLLYPVAAAWFINSVPAVQFFQDIGHTRPLLSLVIEFFIVIFPGIVAFWGMPVQDRGDRMMIILLMCIPYLIYAIYISFVVGFSVCMAAGQCVPP